MPLVSVILPVNRDDGFLHEAINSVLRQTLKQIELLIIANNCDDALWERVQTITDLRVRCIRSVIGQLPFSLNLGIEHARAPFIARMDADDICEPDRLEKQLAYLQQRSDIAVVGSSYVHINSEGTIVGYPKPIYLSPADILRHLPFESCLPHPTVMIRKEILLAVSGYAFGLYAEDWDLWLRMSRAGYRFANLPDNLLKYRIHSGQSTSLKSVRRNIGNTVGLLLREFIITGRLAFIVGAVKHVFFTLIQVLVNKIRTMT